MVWRGLTQPNFLIEPVRKRFEEARMTILNWSDEKKVFVLGAVVLTVVFSIATVQIIQGSPRVEPPASDVVAAGRPAADQQTTTKGLVPADRASYTLVKFDDDANFLYQGKQVVRKTVRVLVPPGLSKKVLTATLEGAAWAVYDEFKPNAVMVFAYRQGDSVDGLYTAGRCLLAPNGQWEDAKLFAERSEFKSAVETSDLYFHPLQSAGVGSQVTLFAKDTTISLSRGAESWVDADILAELPSGVPAQIIEVRHFPMGETELIRYRLIVRYKGKSLSGWVHKFDVK